MGDHTETTQVDFDPERLPYRKLLEVVWQSHHPARNHPSRQYQNAIFYSGEAQRAAVEESRAEVERRLGRPVRTVVAPLGRFYPAEDYHQKYYLREFPQLVAELSGGGGPEAFRESHAAARLNGYVSGHGGMEQFERERSRLGLSLAGEALVRRILQEQEGAGASCGV
jgi:hypothetical protein